MVPVVDIRGGRSCSRGTSGYATIAVAQARACAGTDVGRAKFGSDVDSVYLTRPLGRLVAPIPLSTSLHQPSRTKSAPRAPISIAGALVLPVGSLGVIDMSITRRPSTPYTLSRGSTTEDSSTPILHVPPTCLPGYARSRTW